MDTYSRIMHASEITTSRQLFFPVSYTMRAFLVFPPLPFSKGKTLREGCMRDRANEANSANCDQSCFPLYCYKGRCNLIIDQMTASVLNRPGPKPPVHRQCSHHTG